MNEKMSIGSLIRPVLIWCFLVVGVGGFLFGRSLVGALIVLGNRQTVAGTITELPRRKPAIVSYELEGRRYRTDTSCLECLGIATLDQVRVGDQVRVEYNPAKPRYGIPGSAKKLLLSDVQYIAFTAMFLVFAVAYFEFNFRNYARRRNGPIEGPTEHNRGIKEIKERIRS